VGIFSRIFGRKKKHIENKKTVLESVERYEQPVVVIGDDEVMRRRQAAKVLQFLKLGNVEEAECRAKFFYDRGEIFPLNEQHCQKVIRGL